MRMIDNDVVGLKNSQKIPNCFIWNCTFRNAQGRYSLRESGRRCSSLAWSTILRHTNSCSGNFYKAWVRISLSCSWDFEYLGGPGPISVHIYPPIYVNVHVKYGSNLIRKIYLCSSTLTSEAASKGATSCDGSLRPWKMADSSLLTSSHKSSSSCSVGCWEALPWLPVSAMVTLKQ